MKTEIVLQAAGLLAACVGGWTDLRYRKIPNRLTMPVMAAGILLNLVLGGLGGMFDSLCGIGLAFAFILLFALGALKAGDVKLYMAVGAVGGWRYVLDVMIFSILIGGIFSFFLMLSRRSGRKKLKNLWNYGVNLLLTHRFYMYEPQEESSYFSFGCCIAAGAAIVLGKTVIYGIL